MNQINIIYIQTLESEIKISFLKQLGFFTFYNPQVPPSHPVLSFQPPFSILTFRVWFQANHTFLFYKAHYFHDSLVEDLDQHRDGYFLAYSISKRFEIYGYRLSRERFGKVVAQIQISVNFLPYLEAQ